MNGIEKITARIDEEAQAEIDRILTDARARADEIAAKYQAQADEEAAALAARNEKSAAEREERLVSVAQMESRKVLLAAKQEMVEKSYALALEKLCAMADAQYVEVLAALMVQASSTGHEEAVFSKKDREQVGEAAVKRANELLQGGRLTLSEETRGITGGFILKEGNIEVNCTFETLVRLQKAETAGAVAERLFPKG
ncbi:V/A-type H+-transporting ATPase subunit E [Oscillibacter sp. PC13]|uniref:V-type ATP synthase subunit E n=1 Tax=Oscillibacter sp. PC13 TaxID=1855299 RepID=UPI0008ED8868|nr:V-type ATP synthase subunit E [Oscillibacter sp. PC13]SFP09177.1 V/A-type H+-transporting ATPase subunit E [Oscillibacter sp. PC13]